MDVFSQKKYLHTALIVLVILNLCLVGFFIYSSFKQSSGKISLTKPNNYREPLLFPKNETYRDVTPTLKKELLLTDRQVEQFNEIRKRNFEKQVVLKSLNRDLKDSMNVQMFKLNIDEKLIQLLVKKIAENEYQNQLLRFEQSKELKAVCTPAQQLKFEQLVKEIRDFFRPDNQPLKR